MILIDDFMADYDRKFDYYDRLARRCEQFCRHGLEAMAVRSLITSRTKEPSKLHEKIVKRNVQKHYDTMEAIYDDIIDLAGVRIAVYFPNDVDRVRRFIDETFEIKSTKEFPEQSKLRKETKHFAGYKATHYIVSIPDGLLDRSEKRLATGRIEIQVSSSVLMHAWAEVEHDLVYKPASGELSKEELAILDGINGLVLSGEIYLRLLREANLKRVSTSNEPIRDYFELGAYLGKRFQGELSGLQVEVGNVEVLFNILKVLDEDTPERLSLLLESFVPNEIEFNSSEDNARFIRMLSDNLEGSVPLVNQIIFHMINRSDASRAFVIVNFLLRNVMSTSDANNLSSYVSKSHGLQERPLPSADEAGERARRSAPLTYLQERLNPILEAFTAGGKDSFTIADIEMDLKTPRMRYMNPLYEPLSFNDVAPAFQLLLSIGRVIDNGDGTYKAL